MMLVLLLQFLLALTLVSSEESSQQQPPTTTALLTASGEGDHQRVKYLLEVLKVDVNELSPDGETALHAAAIRGDPETTRLLLEHGAVVDARSPSGTQRSMTPLQWACYGGHEGMITLLLKAGADPWLKDETGMTAFDMAIESGHDNVLHLLEGSWREEKQREEL